MTGFRTAISVSRRPAAAFLAMGIVWGTFMATMPDIKAALGVDDGAMGFLLLWGAVAAITTMILAPFIGAWLGRAALPLFTVLMGLALALQSHAIGPLAFTLALMAMGAATGALEVFMNARLSAIEAARTMSLMNLNHALYALGFGAAAALTGLARAAGSSQSTILLTAALIAVTLATFSYDKDGAIEGLVRDKSVAGGPQALGLVPILGGLLVLAGLMSENSIEAWSALFIERDLGGAIGAGSYAPALLGLMMGIGRLAGQSVTRRIADFTLLTWGLILAVAGVALVVAAPSPAMAYAGFIVMGLGGSVIVPTTFAIIGRVSTSATRSRAIARATVLGYVGYFVGPPLLGITAEYAGLRMAFGLIAVILLMSLVVRSFLARFIR